jgi:hypothetical protein
MVLGHAARQDDPSQEETMNEHLLKRALPMDAVDAPRGSWRLQPVLSRLAVATRYQTELWNHGRIAEPGRLWNECAEIHRDGRFTDGFAPDILPAWQDFLATIRRRPQRSVWYDRRRNVCFGNDLSCLNTASLEAFLLTGPGEMLDHPKVGRAFVRSYFGQALGVSAVESDEAIYQDHPSLRRFKGAKLLLIGAGPTTRDVAWHPADYDHIWSCNQFYLSERLRNVEVALATLGDEVDVSPANRRLYEYLATHQTLIGFENTHRPIERIRGLADAFPGRVFYAHGRYRGKIGTVPRLLCLAVLLGAAEIHVVGMDGMGPDTKRGDPQRHAFESDKPYGKGTLDYDVFRRHFVMLWDYVLNELGALGRVRFQNLGEGCPVNQSTDISRQVFPLKRHEIH